MELRLRHEGWCRQGRVSVRGRAFDGESALTAEAIAGRLAESARGAPVRDEDTQLAAIAAAAAGLEGFYAAVVDCEDHTYLVADGVRSIPLYYSDGRDDTGGVVVSDDGETVARAVGAERDPVTAAEFLLTRYVTGPDTIWRGVHATQAGEVVRLDGTPTRRTYREHWPGTGETASDPQAVLARGLDRALDRLEAVAAGRPVVVPLSGGYDSRLLAASLVERGHPVTAFTFGRPGHPDVEVSREVADRLGIDWELVEYSQARWREWYHGPAGRRLRDGAFGGDALPFVAAHPAVKRLRETGRMPADAVWCPGHTVATPGERLPLFAGEADDEGGSFDCVPAVEADGDPDRERIPATAGALVESILDSHYTLWAFEDPAFEAAARERIRRELLGDRTPSAVDDPESAAAAYERWEWRGRMTTFTAGDLRGYEAAGVDWWLPLWDPAYVRAWERLAAADRRAKRTQVALAVERYRRAADVPADRAGVTDRTLAPVDRLLARVRHTPVRTVTNEGIEWEPPFLAPRSAWRRPDSHPLAWDGIVAPALRARLPGDRSLYALRTLALLRDIDLADPEATLPDGPLVELPTAEN
jgi:asparagine synthase (glutamine-hydrolysing)